MGCGVGTSMLGVAPMPREPWGLRPCRRSRAAAVAATSCMPFTAQASSIRPPPSVRGFQPSCPPHPGHPGAVGQHAKRLLLACCDGNKRMPPRHSHRGSRVAHLAVSQPAIGARAPAQRRVEAGQVVLRGSSSANLPTSYVAAAAGWPAALDTPATKRRTSKRLAVHRCCPQAPPDRSSADRRS